MQTLLVFIVFLGPLVFFHELGHFLFARLFGVRVEVFSIGFGPKLFKKKWGNTEYTVSLIPLGGYVKMFGDNPLSEDKLTEEEKKVAFTEKSKIAKFWIVFGGPLANFILAFVLYFCLVVAGEKVPQAKLGHVNSNNLLHSLGFKSGDVIKEVNKQEIVGMDDFNLIDSNIKSFTVQRFEETIKLSVDIKSMDFIKAYSDLNPNRSSVLVNSKGEYFYVSKTKKTDLSRSFEELLVGLTSPSDLYVSKVKSDLSKLGRFEDLEVDESSLQVISNVTKENIYSKLAQENLYISDLSIYNVTLSSAAAEAGLQKNDIILGLNGTKISKFEDLKSIVSASESGKAIEVNILRGKENKSYSIIPKEKDGKKLIGVQSGIVFYPVQLVNTKSNGVVASFTKAFYRTKEGITKTAIGYKKLITGEVSLKHIGGPFQIASIAADSFSISLSMFFRLMALISINLGLVNLLPIPVLDGGHIVILIAETIKRGPLSKKALMRLQQVGVSLLFILMFFAITNDISKFF